MKPISYLTAEEVKLLRAKQRSASRALGAAGYTPAKVQAALHPDINDAFERKSAACAYEQLRARVVLGDIGAEAFIAQETLKICLGNPRCRRPLGQLHTVSIRPVLRKSADLFRALSADGWSVKGFAVAEVHLVVPMNGEPFWEPHAHALMCGAPRDAVRPKCRVRPAASVSPLRTRHTMVKPVTALKGATSYIAKFKPESANAYVVRRGQQWATMICGMKFSPSGRHGWRGTRSPTCSLHAESIYERSAARVRAKWRRVMA